MVWKEMTEIERRRKKEEWQQHLDMLTRFHPENVIPEALLFLEETHNEPVLHHPAGVLRDSSVKKNLGRGRGRGTPLKEKEDEEFIARYVSTHIMV